MWLSNGQIEKRCLGRQGYDDIRLSLGTPQTGPLSHPHQFELGTPELPAYPSMRAQVVVGWVADDYDCHYPRWYLV